MYKPRTRSYYKERVLSLEFKSGTCSGRNFKKAKINNSLYIVLYIPWEPENCGIERRYLSNFQVFCILLQSKYFHQS